MLKNPEKNFEDGAADVIEEKNDFIFQNIEFKSYPERKFNKPANKAEKEKMAEGLNTVITAIEGANIKWSLEGGAAISALKGEFIRLRKDWDIEIEAKDLPTLEKHLQENGYRLFFRHQTLPGDKTAVAERTNFQQVMERKKEFLVLFAALVNTNGQIIKKGESFELSLIERDEKTGEPLDNDLPLPEKWFIPKEVYFNGKEIKVGQPAKLIYYKISLGRTYDVPDLISLAESGFVSQDDIEEVERIIKEDKEQKEKLIMQFAERMSATLRNENNSAKITEILINDPLISSQTQKAIEKKPAIETIAGLIAAETDKPAEKILEIINQQYDLSSVYQEQLKKIAIIKKTIDDYHKNQQ